MLIYTSLGLLKTFTLTNFTTNETYTVSLFYEYKSQYFFRMASWYKDADIYFWVFIFILHLALAYLLASIVILFNNRLRGKDW